MLYGKAAKKKKENNEKILISGLFYYALDSSNYVPSFGRTTNKNLIGKNTEERRVRGKPREASKNSR